MLAIGAVLLAGAAILAPVAVTAVRGWLRRRAAADLRPETMASRAGETLSLRGTAVPGPAGALESRLVSSECVWHGHEVRRHYWPLPRDVGEGDTVERTYDPIAEYGSTDPFGIASPAGGPRGRGRPVLVDPTDAEVAGPDMCLQRVVQRPQRGVPAPADDLLPRVKGQIVGLFRGETIEFEYREWVLRPGAPITVHGALEERGGALVLTAPSDGRLRIEQHGTTAPEARGGAAGALLLSAAAGLAAVAGLVLVLAGL
ncbi:E3 ubiquitin ligase [Haloactinospora alba]|uniref:RING-type E3 ubiquitin transferase n=1 Tax=Haloactinospora alba TaxID=405555 RepID=A0A543N6X4_9ACTN|nr:GIDE domain-containing protein [Haloactinospora alba]TQN27589.1 E3 ubiquitin ligase [Haloactinospora alba]